MLTDYRLVTVAPLDESRTVVDSSAHQPRSRPGRGTPITVEAEVQTAEFQIETGPRGGLGQRKGEYRISVKRETLRRYSWTPTIGDLITAITDRENVAQPVRLYVQRMFPLEGFWDQAGVQLEVGPDDPTKEGIRFGS